MMRSVIVALLMSVALPVYVSAEPVKTLAPEEVATERTLIRIADALDRAVDAKNWSDARSYFTADIFVDMSSAGGGEPGTVKADDLIAGWRDRFGDDVRSFHLRGNHIVNFQTKSRALMTSHGYAFNAAADGDAFWEIWGVYEYRYEKIASGWKIASFIFRATRERGERP